MLDHQMNSEQIDRGIEKSHTHGTVAHVPVHVPTPGNLTRLERRLAQVHLLHVATQVHLF